MVCFKALSTNEGLIRHVHLVPSQIWMLSAHPLAFEASVRNCVGECVCFCVCVIRNSAWSPLVCAFRSVCERAAAPPEVTTKKRGLRWLSLHFLTNFTHVHSKTFIITEDDIIVETNVNFTWILLWQTWSDLIPLCVIKGSEVRARGKNLSLDVRKRALEVIGIPPSISDVRRNNRSHLVSFWLDIMIIFLPLSVTAGASISLAFLLATSANTTSPLSLAT